MNFSTVIVKSTPYTPYNPQPYLVDPLRQAEGDRVSYGGDEQSGGHLARGTRAGVFNKPNSIWDSRSQLTGQNKKAMSNGFYTAAKTNKELIADCYSSGGAPIVNGWGQFIECSAKGKTSNRPRATAYGADGFYNISGNGTQTIAEVAAQYNVPMSALSTKYNVPVSTLSNATVNDIAIKLNTTPDYVVSQISGMSKNTGSNFLTKAGNAITNFFNNPNTGATLAGAGAGIGNVLGNNNAPVAPTPIPEEGPSTTKVLVISGVVVAAVVGGIFLFRKFAKKA